jgi:hypothetical protein
MFYLPVLDKTNSTNRHTNTNENLWTERSKGHIPTKLRTEGDVCHIKHNRLGGALREDGCLDEVLIIMK